MKKLIEGVNEFRENYVSTHRDLLENLSHGQDPSVLFITCSDSRISPSLMTQTDLGDLFVIRNAGNIIPPYGAANGGEGAAVEYAIHALGIEQIVVCGHSHCGAMKGLLQLGKLEEEMPLVYDWLKHAEATRRLVKENYGDRNKEELLEITIAENVLTQIENLKTYPVVRSRLYQGKLKIYGWVYLIETGEVLAYDEDTHSYIAPQSQIDYVSENEKLVSRAVSSVAPPVACELPLTEEELAAMAHRSNGAGTHKVGTQKAGIQKAEAQKPGQRTQNTEPQKVGTPSTVPQYVGNPRLSAAQSDRIYRGSRS
ncbi:MAG: carbonic anhydrase [Drouetiella hepatica Uher 2000/2452]|uniref:Carbonic anhydrase n=1 Tax=Drouetiella hepatica Uher 2000/2452 TaxID=904376 RepID=A0A951UM55_9CYAN|nr:carbonic anhydrase [Drouetiella hepatica Uher 2000/2452]